MADGEVARLIPLQTDHELAEDYRKRMREALEHTTAIMNEAESRGLRIGFNIGSTLLADGRRQMHFAQVITVFKPL